MYQQNWKCLAYADEIAVIATTKVNLQNAIRRTEDTGRIIEIEINEPTTKYMEITKEKDKRNNRMFERVDKFHLSRSNSNRECAWKDKNTGKISERAKMFGGNEQHSEIKKSVKKTYRTNIYENDQNTVTHRCEAWMKENRRHCR